MNELQEIIERFKEVEKVCWGLREEYQSYGCWLWYAARADAYGEVVRVLEDFMSKHAFLIFDIHKMSEAVAEGYRALIKDLEEERSN